MKQPKRLTCEQKRCLSAHSLNWKDWMFVEETEFCYRIINKKTGAIKSVDKFRREAVKNGTITVIRKMSEVPLC